MTPRRRGVPRAMVTGGAGFIGSNLVDRLLAENYAVDVVDDLSTGSLANLSDARSDPAGDVTFHQIDVRSEEMVEVVARRRPEVIFHLAAQADVRVSVQRPVFDAEVNIVGTLRVLQGAQAAGVQRVVFAASGGTLYGKADPADLPLKESHPHVPLSPYGVSKKSAIDYLVTYRDLYDIEFCALALSNVYGPRQDPHGEAGVVAIFAERVLTGQPLTVFGDGTQTRDFVFVDDVVDAFFRSASKGGGLVMNVGTGKEVTVNALAQVMIDRSASQSEIVHAPARPGELHRSALDPSRAEIHLGWRPWTELADGIDAVLEQIGRSIT